MTNIKFKQINSLPSASDSGTIYYLSDGSQYIGKSDGTFLKVTDIEFVTTLPSSPKDKLYALIVNDVLKLYAYKDGKYIELSSSVKSHTHLISEITNLQTILDELRADVDKKAELPIPASQVNESTDKVFVSSSQRSQITSNMSAIDINTQRIQNLEDKLDVVTSTDEKVKMNANDNNASYLEDKLDNSTIIQQNNKLTIPFINSIGATIEEINHLTGVTSNIQQQINNISGVSAFRGVFTNLDELQALADSQEGEYAIVSDGTNSSYYFFYGNQWDFSHETNTVVNIDLANTTGKLPKDRYEKQNAQETHVVNTQGNFTGNNVEDVLNELFTLSNSSKNGIVSAIGFPLVNNDTFTQMKTKIEQLKIIFANYLVAHEIPAYHYETLSGLIEKIKSIEAVETTGSTKIKENIKVTSTPHIENITLDALVPMKQFGMSVLEFSEGEKNVEHYNAKFNEYQFEQDIVVDEGIGIKHDYDLKMNELESQGNYNIYEVNVNRKPISISFNDLKYKSYDLNMTNNNNPSPYVASASSTYQDLSPHMAFDGIDEEYTADVNAWASLINQHINSWIKIDFGSELLVNNVVLTGRIANDQTPIDFRIESSLDDENWNVVKSFSNISWDINEQKTIELPLTRGRYFRIVNLRFNKTEYAGWCEIKYGFTPEGKSILKSTVHNKYYTIQDNTLVELSDGNLDTIINNGILPNDSIFVDNIENFETTIGTPFSIISYTNSDKAPALNVSFNHSERKLATSPDVLLLGVESINSIVVNSSTSPLTVISINNGSSWLSYENGNWVTVENAHQGMSMGTLNNIPSEALTRIKGESNYIRFQHSFGNNDEISSLKMNVDFEGNNGILDTAYYSFDYSGGQLQVTLKKQGNYSIVYTDVDV